MDHLYTNQIHDVAEEMEGTILTHNLKSLRINFLVTLMFVSIIFLDSACSTDVILQESAIPFPYSSPNPNHTPRSIDLPDQVYLDATQIGRNAQTDLSYSDRFIVILPSTNVVEKMCVVVLQKGFWEVGVSGDELQQQISSTLLITVDDNQIPIENIEIVDYLMDEISEFDDEGNVIGSYRPPLDVCLLTQNLSSGSHRAKIEAANISGDTYSYTWDFTVR